MKGSEVFALITGFGFLLLALLAVIELITLFGNWLNSLSFMQGLVG